MKIPMKILKFGGSSLATPERVRRVVSIVERARRDGRVVVVVSALGGVTDRLAQAADTVAIGLEEPDAAWREVAERHRSALVELAAPAERDALGDDVEAVGRELRDLLRGVALLHEVSPRTRDSILAVGERLSSLLVAAALRAAGVGASARDARGLLVTDHRFGAARVDLEASTPRIRSALGDAPDVAVVTGFVAATASGETTTLGRGGSDSTAALLAAALGADVLELWKDVPGILSADPRVVPEAFPLERLSWEELLELSHFGAEVVHPPSVQPLRRAGIPLVIRHTFDPEAPGTSVRDGSGSSTHPVRGITSIPEVALLRLEGEGMVGEPGIAGRLFDALARRRVSVILITQASSEHSICVAVAPEAVTDARDAVEEEFALERRVGLVRDPVVEKEMAVIAVVGEGMRHRPGLAGRLFRVLGERRINIHVVAQGSSELNVSMVVASHDRAAALGAIHDAFFRPSRRRVDLAVAGTGRVASALLDQIRDAAPGLAERDGLELRVMALFDRRRLLRREEGIDLDAWRRELEGDAAEAPDLQGALDHVARPRGAVPVLVDCTASDALAELYGLAFGHGVSVVAANKRPFSAGAEGFAALGEAAAEGGVGLRFETTVGAGLPVLSTLESLVRTGDRIDRVDGVLSGTLNFVLDRVTRGEAFSDAVRRAHEDGLTEPHPAEDLSGGDVARKLVILARAAGGEGAGLELTDVEVEPLLPADGGWGELDLESFWERLPELDEVLARRRDEALEAGARLRYVASLAEGRARVAVEAVGPDHPCHGVDGPDNLVAFTTRRYADTPLVVAGPGAGPAVTAAGVFADILQVADRLR